MSHKPDRMVKHFSDVLNCQKPVDNDILLQISSAPSSPEAESLSEPLTVAEIIRALGLLLKGKVPGDGISVELLQLEGSTIVETMKKLADQIWKQESVPANWWKQLVVPIFKNKGSRGQCDNYYGISLLSAASEVIGKVILTRIERVVEYQLSESQCGFHPERGCANHIFALRIAMENSLEFQCPLYMAFIDLRKANDLVNRNALWYILQHACGIPEKLVKII